jgi:hypothetical protein
LTMVRSSTIMSWAVATTASAKPGRDRAPAADADADADAAWDCRAAVPICGGLAGTMISSFARSVSFGRLVELQ